MKWKVLAVVVVALLIAAQMIFGGKREPGADAAIDASASAPAAGAAESGLLSATPPPSPDDVSAVVIGDGEHALRLNRGEHDWSIAGRDDAPADEEKIHTLLRHLLAADRRPVPLGDSGKTGLEDGGGLPVSLSLKSGGNYDLMIGLRPVGVYNSAYVRLPDGGVAIVDGDVRGDLGLWRNTPDARPNPAAWLEKRALTFDPSHAVRIEANYPDHNIVFEKSPEGDWQPGGYVPGERWSNDGLTAWLRDLSDFQIADAIPSGEFPADASGKTHSIRIGLEDGGTKSVSVQPNHGGEGMLAATSDHPGRVFHLPDWRFRKYFRRLPSLFPEAVPNFELSRVRFVDVRKGGETVKIARRDGAWEAVALPYSLKPGAVDRLVRMLASWRPEDYAAPDFKAIRPGYGGPMVEIILDGGDVHQYRLAGRHPLFPWRYVTLDGKSIFSVTDPEAGVMFPGFADILDLGRVFRDATLEDVTGVELSDADRKPLLAFRRGDDGAWSVASHGQELGLLPVEAERILGELMHWRVTGFYNADTPVVKQPPQFHLRLSGKDGFERHVTFLQPEERDIPYLADGERGYLVDRADFQNWIASARETGHRLNAAVERARQEAEEREAKQSEAAEDVAEDAAPADDNVMDDASAVDEQDAASQEPVVDEVDEPAEAPAQPETPEDAAPATAEEETPPESEAPETDAEPEPETAETDAASETPEAGQEEDAQAAAEVGQEDDVAPTAGSEFAEPAGEAVSPAEDSEETEGEPAGGDVLIHAADADMNVAGEVTEDVTTGDDVLTPEAETAPDQTEPSMPDAPETVDADSVERFVHKYIEPSAQATE